VVTKGGSGGEPDVIAVSSRRGGTIMSEGVGLRVATDTVVTIEYSARLTNGEPVTRPIIVVPITYLHGTRADLPGARAGRRRVGGG